jgi:hypothetical protein
MAAFAISRGVMDRTFYRVHYFDYGDGAEDPHIREALISGDQVSSIREIRPDPDEPPILEISMMNGDTFHVLAQLEDFMNDE